MGWSLGGHRVDRGWTLGGQFRARMVDTEWSPPVSGRTDLDGQEARLAFAEMVVEGGEFAVGRDGLWKTRGCETTMSCCPETHPASRMPVQPISWYSLPSCIPLFSEA